MLECRKIIKDFVGVRALDGVSVRFGAGRVTGLLGENGAGKSTLMNIIYGLIRPDGGEMRYRGEVYSPASPFDAISAGIGMVHQSHTLIDEFSVLENIILGAEPSGALGRINRARAEKRLSSILAILGFDLKPRRRVATLDPLQKQIVEIAKTLHREADFIILDEPTALLAAPQIERLFEVIRSLRENGKTVVLVTHRISEVEAVVDDVVVLRRGRVQAACKKAQTNRQELVRSIVGDEAAEREESRILYADTEAEPAAQPESISSKAAKETLLELRSVSTAAGAEGVPLRNLSLKIAGGEIVGLTGVPGNGQTVLFELLAGLTTPASGRIFYKNEKPGRGGFTGLRRLPAGYIFADRDEQCLIPEFTLAENMLLSSRKVREFSKCGVIKRHALTDFAERSAREFDIASAGAMKPVRILSGGNRQKVVLARETAAPLEMLIAMEPVRGLDIKTTGDVRRLLLGMKADGKGILLITGDIDFLMTVADRIGVLYRGDITYISVRRELDRATLGNAMLGYS